jgi:ABC-type Fe3+-citrate transport system substrate-binding protein
MTGVYFSWINDKVDSRRLGFIAQEMEKVLPEVVFTNQVDGLKGINYPEITAVLVQAVKEQQKQIESQNERIERLERMIEEMQGSKMTGNSK